MSSWRVLWFRCEYNRPSEVQPRYLQNDSSVAFCWNDTFPLTCTLGLVVQAVQVLQNPLHRNLLRSFELSADTVSENSRDQRPPKPRQRRRPTGRHRPHRHHRQSFTIALQLQRRKERSEERCRTCQTVRSTRLSMTTNVGRTSPCYCFRKSYGCRFGVTPSVRIGSCTRIIQILPPIPFH